MKIPESVRIAGSEYEVIHEDMLLKNDRLCYGTIDFNGNTIHLSKTDACGDATRKITLLHEILHGICLHYGIELADKEEDVVERMAFGLYQVLSDNEERFFK